MDSALVDAAISGDRLLVVYLSLAREAIRLARRRVRDPRAL
jgi:hypothetical protein